MKALTLRHPWPWAVCYLGKPVENRTWQPSPTQLRPGERFAIHAGKMPSHVELGDGLESLSELGIKPLPGVGRLRSQESSIVAVVTFGGVVTEHPSRWFFGPYGWLLNDLIVLPTPVKCRGAQGLWNVPDDVLEQMRAQFRTYEDRSHMTRTFLRSHAFTGPDPVGQILDWCSSKSSELPAVYVGPDGSVRGSVEVDSSELPDDGEAPCPA